MAKSPQPRKVSRILLVLSLGLNVLLIGAIVGTFAKGGGGPPRGGFDLQLGPLGQALPRKDRAEIGRELRRSLRDTDLRGRDRAAAATALIEMLEAETFDPAALTEIIRSQQERQDRVRDTALAAFVNQIGGMSVAERRDIAATLRERLEDGRNRR